VTAPLDDDLFGADRREIEADDWSDQDLLTKDEARLRIEQTIRVTESELERARVSEPARVPQLELYLQRARAVLDFIAKPSAPAGSDPGGS
jgi:hypothetical protein